MATSDEVKPPVDIKTDNDYALNVGQNLPNHSATIMGRGKFVRQSLNKVPEFRTKQAAYRYAAYLVTQAEAHLPDEDGCEAHDFETVLNVIHNA